QNLNKSAPLGFEVGRSSACAHDPAKQAVSAPILIQRCNQGIWWTTSAANKVSCYIGLVKNVTLKSNARREQSCRLDRRDFSRASAYSPASSTSLLRPNRNCDLFRQVWTLLRPMQIDELINAGRYIGV